MLTARQTEDAIHYTNARWHLRHAFITVRPPANFDPGVYPPRRKA